MVNNAQDHVPFRVDEILVLFEIVGQSGITSDEAQAQASEIFESLTDQIARPPFPSEPIILTPGGVQRYVVIRAPLITQDERAALNTISRLNRSAQQALTNALRLVSAGPDFFAGAGQNWDDGGGPGGRPIMGQGRYFRPNKALSLPQGESTFVNQELNRILGTDITDEPVGTNINVAILDTWPVTSDTSTDPAGVIAAFVAANSVTAAQNPLLIEASTAGFTAKFVNRPPSISVVPRQVNWTGSGSFETGYTRPSHGLFAAGIIHDIAPGARLLVYRVLNDHGAALAGDIIWALNDAQTLSQSEGRRLVINMSIGLFVPVRMIPILDSSTSPVTEAAQIAAFKATANAGSPEIDLAALDAAGAIDTATTPWGLTELVAWTGTGPIGAGVVMLDVILRILFGDTNFILVAAAGNDSDRNQGLIFPPRLPAALNGVIGVSATREISTASSFSNRDDLNSSRNEGVAAFGGEREQPTADPYRTGSGLAGLSVEPQLFSRPTSSLVPNTTGWAEWAGTSFATPIVTGIIAAILEESPSLTREQVTKKLTNPAFGPNNEIVLVQHP